METTKEKKNVRQLQTTDAHENLQLMCILLPSHSFKCCSGLYDCIQKVEGNKSRGVLKMQQSSKNNYSFGFFCCKYLIEFVHTHKKCRPSNKNNNILK